MTEWIPVIVAVLTTLSAICSALGKAKAQTITDVLVDQIERFDSDSLKQAIAYAADKKGVGDKLAKVVKAKTED